MILPAKVAGWARVFSAGAHLSETSPRAAQPGPAWAGRPLWGEGRLLFYSLGVGPEDKGAGRSPHLLPARRALRPGGGRGPLQWRPLRLRAAGSSMSARLLWRCSPRASAYVGQCFRCGPKCFGTQQGTGFWYDSGPRAELFD
ncbi:hypothetical protein NDU88_006082 [Pleurodeles waltl]|uniref:Uncharacterized protein n=1 Tax=Pleurodeles waltl TaxID=8319 RepID=A0AAV7QN64_PLEWA|nr:hypothetical protein NDU88_006082 [Pleurodeles waltl]